MTAATPTAAMACLTKKGAEREASGAQGATGGAVIGGPQGATAAVSTVSCHRLDRRMLRHFTSSAVGGALTCITRESFSGERNSSISSNRTRRREENWACSTNADSINFSGSSRTTGADDRTSGTMDRDKGKAERSIRCWSKMSYDDRNNRKCCTSTCATEVPVSCGTSNSSSTCGCRSCWNLRKGCSYTCSMSRSSGQRTSPLDAVCHRISSSPFCGHKYVQCKSSCRRRHTVLFLFAVVLSVICRKRDEHFSHCQVWQQGREQQCISLLFDQMEPCVSVERQQQERQQPERQHVQWGLCQQVPYYQQRWTQQENWAREYPPNQLQEDFTVSPRHWCRSGKDVIMDNNMLPSIVVVAADPLTIFEDKKFHDKKKEGLSVTQGNSNDRKESAAWIDLPKRVSATDSSSTTTTSSSNRVQQRKYGIPPVPGVDAAASSSSGTLSANSKTDVASGRSADGAGASEAQVTTVAFEKVVQHAGATDATAPAAAVAAETKAAPTGAKALGPFGGVVRGFAGGINVRADGASRHSLAKVDAHVRVMPDLLSAVAAPVNAKDDSHQHAQTEARKEQQRLRELHEVGKDQLYREYVRQGLVGGPFIELLAQQASPQRQWSAATAEELAYSHSPSCPWLLGSAHTPWHRSSGDDSSFSSFRRRQSGENTEEEGKKGWQHNSQTSGKQRFPAKANSCPPIRAVRPSFGLSRSAVAATAPDLPQELPSLLQRREETAERKRLKEEQEEEEDGANVGQTVNNKKTQGSSRATSRGPPTVVSSSSTAANNNRSSSPTLGASKRFSLPALIPHDASAVVEHRDVKAAVHTVNEQNRVAGNSDSPISKDSVIGKHPIEGLHQSTKYADSKGTSPGISSLSGAARQKSMTEEATGATPAARGEELHGDVIFEALSHRTLIIRQPHKEARARAVEKHLSSESSTSHTFLQGVETGADGAAPAGEAPVKPIHLYSRVQQELDQECAALVNKADRGQVYARWTFKEEIRCYNAADLDWGRSGRWCVDSCGGHIVCYGDYSEVPNSKAPLLFLNFKSRAMKVRYCVNSRLQAAYNNICGWPDSLYRVVRGQSSCVSAEKIDWKQNDAVCVDDCGRRSNCFGVVDDPDAAVPTTDDQVFLLTEQLRNFCPCNETVKAGQRYLGCQTVTRTGRTCQVWGQQTPHPHSELSDVYLNYCRNPYLEAEIWCYTTDPDMRYDYCDPLGLNLGSVQPGETVDVVSQGIGLTTNIVLRVYEVTEDFTQCISLPADAIPFNTTHFLSSQPGSGVVQEKLPEHTLSRGSTHRIMWENLHIQSNASHRLLFCGCPYDYLDQTVLQRNFPCSKTEFYTLTIGMAGVAGPVYPTAESRITFSTLDEVQINITGRNLSVEDTLMLVQGDSSTACVMPNFFEFQQEIFSNVQPNVDRPLRKLLQESDKIHLRTGFSAVEGGKSARVIPLSVFATGAFSLCWKGAHTAGDAYGVAAVLTLTEQRGPRPLLMPYPFASMTVVQTLYPYDYYPYDDCYFCRVITNSTAELAILLTSPFPGFVFGC